VPELSLANFPEVLIDPVCQVGCFARVLRCHGFSFTTIYSTCHSRTRL
jgi:hypothetical protein